MIKSGVIGSADGLRHGFYTRQGGVSTGLYTSLNCGLGSADDAGNVAENRARCAETLGVGAGALVTAFQVHGTTVTDVAVPWSETARPKADALVTSRRGIAIGILTADCTPVLLADREAGVIAAAHAGWKGAKAGVIDAVVAAMIRHGASATNIVAAIGPTIGAASYEVGPEFRRAFLDDDPAADRFFSTGSDGRPHFDLPGFVAGRLGMLNLAAIDVIAADTYADAERFFSYRRSCHAGEGDYGRQLSAIALA
ncbi:MAG: polyphenol oxidase [Rhodospirillales bacterium]|nr:polyphenol oxidase [Rhodospirillales bacterium]